MVPLDFVIGANSLNPIEDQQALLFANCLAQSQALMTGKNKTEIEQELLNQGLSLNDAQQLASHKEVPGNRPSNTFVYDKLSPFVLGQLIAMYEHKVFVLSVLWNINAFDQWGVELGKQLSGTIKSKLLDTESGTNNPATKTDNAEDSSTSGLINFFQTRIKKPSE